MDPVNYSRAFEGFPDYLPPQFEGKNPSQPEKHPPRPFLDFLSSWENLDRSSQSERRPSYLVRLYQDRNNPGFDLSQSLRKLSSEEKTDLKELVGKKSYGQWLALSGETDSERFYRGVLALGMRYQGRDELEKAQEIFTLLSDPPAKLKVPEVIQKKARREMGAMVGFGEAGARFEFLLSRFVEEASDWKMIVPMIAGATVFQMAKAATLGHWANRGIKTWYTRGKMAEFSAGVVGFVPEVATFTGLGRSFRAWSSEGIPGEEMSLGDELLASTTTLGALKVFGFLGRGLVAKYLSGSKAAEFLVPQVAIFGGLLSAHQFEEWVGLRDPVDGATLVMDTLGALVSLGVGSHLGYKFLGPRMVRFQQDLVLKSKAWARQLKELPQNLLPTFHPLAPEGGPGSEYAWAMVDKKGENPGPGSSRPVHARPKPEPLPDIDNISTLHPEKIRRLFHRADAGDKEAIHLLGQFESKHPGTMARLVNEIESYVAKKLISKFQKSPGPSSKMALLELARRGREAVALLAAKRRAGYTWPMEILVDAARYNPHAVLALHQFAKGGDRETQEQLRILPVERLFNRWENNRGEESLLNALGTLLFWNNAHVVQGVLSLAATDPMMVNILYSYAMSSLSFSSKIRKGLVGLDCKSHLRRAKDYPDSLEAINLLRRVGNRGAGKVLRNFDFTEIIEKAKSDFAYLQAVAKLAWDGVSGALPALGRVAEYNPRAVIVLDDVVWRTHEVYAKEMLMKLNLEYIKTQAETDTIAVEALRLLSDWRHPGARAALSFAGRSNPLAKKYHEQLNQVLLSQPEGLTNKSKDKSKGSGPKGGGAPPSGVLGLLAGLGSWTLSEVAHAAVLHAPSSSPSGPELILAGGMLGASVLGVALGGLRPVRAFNELSLSEKWNYFLGSRAPRPTAPPRLPEFINHRTNSLARSIEAAVRYVPPECKCIFIDVVGKELNQIGERIIPVLEKKPSLEEIRLRFLDGNVTWTARVQGDIVAKDGELAWVPTLKEKILTEREALPDHDPIFNGTDRPPGEIFRVRLFTPWRKFNGFPPTMGELLQQLREGRGLSKEEVVAELRGDAELESVLGYYKQKTIDIALLNKWENPQSQKPIPFPILKAVAKKYHVDIRKLIVQANRKIHRDIPSKFWSTKYDPIYIEDIGDLLRIEHYRGSPENKSVGSFGWLLWSLRKNPANYFSAGQLAKRLGVQVPTLRDWELNRKVPQYSSLIALAELLKVPAGNLVKAINSTFGTEEVLNQLYPGLPIYLDPTGDDLKKIRTYVQSPGSLGQWIFGFRKLMPSSPGTWELSGRLEKNRNYIHVRELNQVHVGRDNLHEWLWLFKEMGIPLALVKETLEKNYGIPVSDPSYLIAEAMAGETKEEVMNRALGGERALNRFLQDKQKGLSPSIILAWQDALPRLEGGKLYLRVYPDMEKVFPETQGKRASLWISPEHAEKSVRDFHLGEALFAFRMNPPKDLAGVKYRSDGTLPLEEAARYLGVTPDQWRLSESSYSWIREDKTLLTFADGLGLDRKTVYMAYRPEVLRLFELKGSAGEAPWELKPETWNAWMQGARENFDRRNLRNKLTPILSRYTRENGNGEEASVVLARILEAPKKLANKYLDPVRPLTADELKYLTDRFPELSYREWYEHFHRPALHFFLGRNPNGEFNYDWAGGKDWNELNRRDVPAQAESSLETRGLDQTARKNLRGILKRMKKGSLTLNAIPFLSRHTGIPSRDLYLWSRRHELRPMIETHNQGKD